MLVDVGQELRNNRKAEPKPEQDSYDEAVGVTYEPFSIETCGYVVEAKPRRIGVREVAGFAKQSCRACYGRGWWFVTRRVEAGRDEAGCKQMQDIGYELTCRCAESRYKRQNPTMLVDSQLGEWIGLDDLVIEPVESQERAAC
jgi:hypothetical protein